MTEQRVLRQVNVACGEPDPVTDKELSSQRVPAAMLLCEAYVGSLDGCACL